MPPKQASAPGGRGGGGGAKPSKNNNKQTSGSGKKGGASAKSSHGKNEVDLVDEGMQAVVMLDYQEQGLDPLTLDCPKALLPVANIPMIEYTLELLAMQKNVTEVILFTVYHADRMRAYLSTSRWARYLEKPADGEAGDVSSSSSTSSSSTGQAEADKASAKKGSSRKFTIKIITTSDERAEGTVGYGLRTLDQRGVLRVSTFLLLEGPVVGCVNLAQAIAAHDARAFPDITLVMRPSTTSTTQHTLSSGTFRGAVASATVAGAASIPLEDTPVIDLDPLDGQIWGYDILPTAEYNVAGLLLDTLTTTTTTPLPPIASITSTTSTSATITTTPTSPPSTSGPSNLSSTLVTRGGWAMNKKVKQDVPKSVAARLRTRADLMETGIYICSPQVPLHFSDHFDYNCLRKDYIRNESCNNVAVSFFYAHIVSGAFAACPRDMRGYSAVTSAVISGWCAPLVPTSAWAAPLGDLPSTHEWKSASPLSSSSSSFIQAGAHVDPTASISGNSLVAAGAKIGANVKIFESVIGAGVVVGDGAVVTNSILLSRSSIGSSSVVDSSILASSTVVGDGCKLGKGCVLGSHVRIATGHSVPSLCRLTCFRKEDDGYGGFTTLPTRLTSASSAAESDAKLVGASGVGRQWPAPGELQASSSEEIDDGEADDNDDESEDSNGGGGKQRNSGGVHLSQMSLALEKVRVALRVYDAETITSSSAAVPGSRNSIKNISSLDAVASAARSALLIPTLAGSCGIPELTRAASCISIATPPEKLALLVLPRSSTSTANGADGGEGSTSSSSSISSSMNTPTLGGEDSSSSASSSLLAGGKPLDSFTLGIHDILRGISVTDTSKILTLVLEIKSFKHAEHRPFADCVRAIMPTILSFIPSTPKPAIGGIISTFKGWAQLLLKMRTELELEDLDQAYAAIASVSSWVCGGGYGSGVGKTGRGASSSVESFRAMWIPMFGVILNVLYDADILTSEAIRMWEEDARDAVASSGQQGSKIGGADTDEEEEEDQDEEEEASDEYEGPGVGSEDAKALLVTAFFKRLMERLDEEEEDDDEEDDEEED